MLRFLVHEQGQPELPALDLPALDLPALLGDAAVVIGSAPAAHVRLPATVARDAHVRCEAGVWHALAEVRVDGVARGAGEQGAIGAGVVLELGAYRIAIAPAPAGVTASPPQRTESLARELVRSLLGDGAAPTLEVERGPIVGARRALPPPGERGESMLVIGRGDEADWVIADEDLSRAHVEIRRGWDGITLRDLGSKNGTRVDGVGVGEVRIGDGARIELGAVVLRFADPAERHLRGEPATAGRPTVTTGSRRPVTPVQASSSPSSRPAPVRPSPWPFVVVAAIAGLAIVGLAWTLAS